MSISLIYEWLGFHSLSEYIWSSVLLIALSLTMFLFLEKLFRDLYDTLDAGEYAWQKKFRSILSIGTDEPIPGSIWLRLLTITVLWVGLGLMILKSIGVSDSRIEVVFTYLHDGIHIGDSQISLYNVLAGVFIFALLLVAIGWIKDSLENKYLVKSKLDSGAREAIVTITGYLGFTIAAIVGLSIAGVRFSNLAIIAGALSVGIGFGLQNIVNNFVSGIILLFERPIRPGDWIATGTTEGYVKRISVRSTEVQTFDRSDVIVPNSDLISTEVTNWTLRDKHGRIIIPVGVAYGSDTELVKKLLEEIPNDIPEIIKDRPMLPVKVLFRNFGDSALDFELRCFIYDIGYVLDVKSRLHFAIDKAFREHNIEIAFPQRDIHIRSNAESYSANE
ncbi:MAG: mechanosensitive ion channel [Gammaproteobacteria bacterium]